MTRGFGRLVGAFLSAALLVAACGGDDDEETTEGSPEEEHDPNAVFRRGVDLTAGGGLNFDPATMGAGQYRFTYPVTNSYLKMTESGEYEMDLADDVEIVDPSTVRVVLKEDLVFSDGEPLDAATAIRSILRTRDAKPAGLRVAGDGLGLIDSMEADSATEFTIHLKTPGVNTLMQLLADAETTPVSPKTMDAPGAHGGDVVTAGPFQIEEFVPGSKVVLTKNDRYWNADGVRFAKIEYLHVTAGAATINGLNSGTIDFATLQHSELPQLQSPVEGDSKIIETAAYRMNMCISSSNPLGDIRVRQALNYATNREAVNQGVYNGESVVAWGLAAPGHRLHNDDLEDLFPYDPQKARSLLAQAGYANGLTLTVVTAAGDGLRISEVVQQQWREAGVDLKIHLSTNTTADWIQAAGSVGQINPSSGLRGIPGSWPRVYASTALDNPCKFKFPGIDECSALLVGSNPTTDEYVDDVKDCSAIVVKDAVFGVPTVFNVQASGIDTDRIVSVAYQQDPISGLQPDVTKLLIRS